MIRCWLLVVCVLMGTAFQTFAQKIRKVTAEYTYYAPENVSLSEARQTALQRAQLQAIADAFGTIVARSNSSTVRNENGKSEVKVRAFGTSEVKGEWLHTDGEPEYEVSYEEGMLVVTVRVKGVIREMVNAPVDFQAKILRNGTEDKFEGEEFRNGDDLYLSFRSPVDGYLMVYLADAAGMVYCLLPYRNETGGRVAVKGNKHYVFFSVANAPADKQSMVDEYTMTCETISEVNQIYIIFSPHLFTKAMDYSSKELQPRQLPREEFQQWLFNNRKSDVEMRVEVKNVIIRK